MFQSATGRVLPNGWHWAFVDHALRHMRKAHQRIIAAVFVLGVSTVFASSLAGNDEIAAQQGVAKSGPSVGTKSVSDGVYSESQAARGAVAYNASCAKCHLENLKGNDMAPALAADDFLSSWNEKTLRALYSLIFSTMPSDAPGSLKSQEVLDIVAYMLQVNGFPAGAEELKSAEDAQQIRITRDK